MRRLQILAAATVLAGVAAFSSAQSGPFSAQIQRFLTTPHTWTAAQVFTVGSGASTAPPVGTLFLSTVSASNVTTGETDLISYPMLANTLAVNGRGVRIHAWGSTAANTNGKTARLYFGATLVNASISITTTGAVWTLDATVIRTGAATQIANGYSNANNSGYNTFTNTAPTETLSGAVTIKVTGQSASASADLTALALVVEAI